MGCIAANGSFTFGAAAAYGLSKGKGIYVDITDGSAFASALPECSPTDEATVAENCPAIELLAGMVNKAGRS